MAKQKKKRNKTYAGTNAALTRPSITKITAVNRSKPAQWWFEHKKITGTVLKVLGIIAFIAILIAGIISAFTK